ncbi:hypothetical protein DMA15_21345 [Streptomyces sp. WAC 01529]|uniref:putative T7SS-secreted protein n=1 Tax=Streptomyces sp. WAC 01529 TaxID=2203205 RepID=UPI000F6B9482|nr:hypothetical protein [Streptomyces sp. WAC 01529]AZM54789.1 hypothetical protein DMA15_21345 [Streptomyces sp. WAC 01529]
MARPKDWQPLRESDPVPGDPVAVREQVKHMKKIAEYLRTQAEALTAMADADNLKGKYAEKLGEDSRALGRKLDEAEDRYREVKGHLSGWAEELEGFQKRADKALGDAKDAKRIIDAHESKPESEKKGKDDEKGAKDGKDDKGDKGSDTEDPALKKAKEDLADARGRVNSAAGDYNERAGHYAGKIRKSIDDDMKDSWWNDFKAWVGDADWIGDWADKLSWLATVVGIAAMFFPALGVIALALTAVVAAAHLLMAVTGNGSWFDVVMDIGALKMARNGVKAAKAIKALQQSSRKTAAGVAKEGAAETRKNAMKNAAKGEKKGGGRSGGDRQKNRARRLRMEQKNQAAGNKVRDAELPQITAQEKASVLGDAKLGQQMKDINKWRDKYPDNTKLAENAREAARQKDALRGSWAVGTGLDTADKGGDLVSDGEYSRMKDRMTQPVGSRW